MTTPSGTIFIVIRDSFGAYSLPLGVWGDKEKAIQQAVRLADSDREEFKEKPRESHNLEGVITNSTNSWCVYEYEINGGNPHE